MPFGPLRRDRLRFTIEKSMRKARGRRTRAAKAAISETLNTVVDAFKVAAGGARPPAAEPPASAVPA